MAQQYGVYTIEISSKSKFHGKKSRLVQTDDEDIEFSKSFHRIHKKYITISKFNIY